MNLEKNKKRFKIFRISFFLIIGFWISILVSFSTSPLFDKLVPFLILLHFINKWVFLIYLGSLVSQVNKSVIVWVLGTFVFSMFGIGPIFAYLKMKNIAIQNNWN